MADTGERAPAGQHTDKHTQVGKPCAHMRTQRFTRLGHCGPLRTRTWVRPCEDGPGESGRAIVADIDKDGAAESTVVATDMHEENDLRLDLDQPWPESQ